MKQNLESTRNALPNTDSFALARNLTQGTEIIRTGLHWRFRAIKICCPHRNFKLYLGLEVHHSLEMVHLFRRLAWLNLELIKFQDVVRKI